MTQTPKEDREEKMRRTAIFGTSGGAVYRPNNAQKMAQAVIDLDRKFEEDETSKRAAAMGLPYFNLYAFPVNQEALIALPEKEARDAQLIPFYRDRMQVKIGMVDPKNPHLTEAVAGLTKRRYKTELYLVSNSSFVKSIDNYRTIKAPHVQQDVVTILPESMAATTSRLKELENEGSAILKISATNLISELLTEAVKMRASDIHLQPEKDYLSIRYRIDGVLQEMARFHSSVRQSLTSRIKVVSKLKLNVTKIPQDGSFVVNAGGREFEIRVSLLPSAYGEAIVLRILSEQKSLNIRELGLRDSAYQVVLQEIAKPHGLILTTGPTGSGKTTALYAFLKQENKPGVKIITLENPVEYRLEGIEQIQIEESKGLTFASALRSVLRQDPDIVMVGEIRDFDTAEVAAQAALTGHMVYSTLHTNDAAGAIPRFLNLGVKPVTLAPALTCILAQRLVRRICDHCKESQELDEPLLNQVKHVLSAIPANSGEKVPENLVFYHGKGCAECNGIGYKGRIGVFEVFVVNEPMQKLIFSEASTVEIKNLAVQQGMVTMLQDGLLKALEGVTDVAEVFRVAEE